jgi:hypothetical protein
MFELFPGVVDVQPELYMTCPANVAIDAADGEQTSWGLGGLGREGLRLPVPESEIGNRSAFEVFVQNQLRIDVGRRLEAWAGDR